MLITFGLHLDGEHGWRPVNRLGMPVLGPLGLLNLLETRLGLLRADCAHAQRVTQYRECLKQLDAPDRFYHASFGIDPIGTSASLLTWRDAWYLHGWNGESPPGAGVRIADMAAVEAAARSLLFPSIGERLARVAEFLARQQSSIDGVELVDLLDAFPKRWREVLAKLPIPSVRAYGPSADPTTVLGRLQIALKAAHEGEKPEGKIAWLDDGSLRVVRAETGLVAARWVAADLAAPHEGVAIIAEQSRSLLDATLDAADVARQGFQDPSSLAPALQVLPLALATVWEPLDVYALLQFLSHPIGPVPGYARRRLAEVVAQFPGIGGPRWREAVEEIVRRHPELAADLRQALAFWVEHTRYDPEQGAPISALLERTRAIRDYFGARLAGQDANRSAAAATGLAQAAAVTAALETLAAQGEASIAPTELEALVAQCTARGAPNFAMGAQVGCVRSVSDPGALVESFDRVVWWQMGAPSLPGHYPWSASEMASLARAGVELPPLAEVLNRRGEDWLRPVLNARRQLVLVLPPQGEEMHPLWQEIQWFVEGVRPEPLESLLTGRAGNDLPAIAHAALPGRRRWWHLPAQAKIPPRTRESYSSLNTFLNAPHQWVLKYAARLNPSNLLAVADENLLYGNLAHRLIDRLFRTNGAFALRGDAMSAWFLREFAAVVAEEGAVLLMPGRRGDYERLRSAMERTIAEFQRQFAAAGIDAVEPERALAGNFTGGELEGVADLVVRNSSGQRAIVDMKWSGGTYHQDRLAKNRHLQLALYAEMLRRETGAWPQVAYFILEASRLLAPDTGFFPEARAVQSGGPGSTAVLWDRFVAAWNWRRSQVDAGLIEVAAEGIEPTAESVAPPDALEPEQLRQEYDDYRWLAGWGG
ncbi:MAG: PD-(D/E)XK nuclease family protein [Sterolibacteriaceae bacterium]|nr:PD-(D/E)XK nuclease family protein [Sterolibacteriaceae bacterium]